jgi:hypothetical protein
VGAHLVVIMAARKTRTVARRRCRLNRTIRLAAVMAATHTLIRQRKTKGLQHDTEAYSDRSDGSGVGGSMGKTRERQIVVKTDRRLLILELGDAGKFQVKSSGWDENRVFLGGDVLEVAVRNGRPTCSRSRRNDLRGTPRSRRKALRNRTVVLRGRRSRPSSRAIAARHSSRRRRHRQREPRTCSAH